MRHDDELDLLDEEQNALEAIADDAGLVGLDRRQFVFLSLASAAAGARPAAVGRVSA